MLDIIFPKMKKLSLLLSLEILFLNSIILLLHLSNNLQYFDFKVMKVDRNGRICFLFSFIGFEFVLDEL